MLLWLALVTRCTYDARWIVAIRFIGDLLSRKILDEVSQQTVIYKCHVR
jgi:hypothetical protein